MSYINLRKGITDVLSKAGTTISKAGSQAQAQINAMSGSKLLKDYQLQQLVATCGPGDVWKIYDGVSKRAGAYKDVSIWILDKRQLIEANKQNARPTSFDALFEQQRRGCSHMTRLKHPGVIKGIEQLEETQAQMILLKHPCVIKVTEQLEEIQAQMILIMLKHPGVIKVIEQLEETQTQMILVTETVVGSLRNVLTQFSSVSPQSVPHGSGGASPSQQHAMALSQLEWLHGTAGLAHCGLTPSVIMLTADGGWKLSGFAFAVPTDYVVPSAEPVLPYTAPELVGGWGGTSQASGAVTPAADIFSLACVAYELLIATGGGIHQLIPVRSNVHDYRTRVSSLSESQDLCACPAALQGVLRSMVSVTGGSRPSAAAFSSCSFFQEDVLLRALRFLETVLQREVSQKAAFLNDLSHFWSQFDDRLLKHKVIPPLLQEMRTELLLQSAALPGETLALLVRHGPTLASLMNSHALATVLVPMYARALENLGAPKMQEEVLRHVMALSESVEYSLFKAAIMPRVYAACLRTTSASVSAVDHTSGTLTCVAQLGEALSKQWGAELTAAKILPLLCPLLMAPSLAPRQFKECMGIVHGMLERIQQKVASGAAGGPTGMAAAGGRAAASPGL
eukprot:gene21793-28814_t